ncbi:MAG: tetratricopeptide repeat protein [Polyangiaceae bacterium]|jgi:hypothetical protein
MRTPSYLARPLALVIAFALCAPSAHAGAGVTPSDATPVQREEAQTHFARARDLYTAKKFDEAAAEFDKSYAIVASPNALFFLARCDRERGKLVAAYSELGRTAAEAREHASEDPRYAKTAEAATEERDALAPQLGFVTVTVTGGSQETTVTVAGGKFPRAALGEPIPVMPGSTEVIVDTPGKPSQRRTVAVFGGEKKTLTFDAGAVEAAPAAEPAAPAPLPPRGPTPEEEAATRGHIRTASYVAGGVAVVGLITFAAAGIASNNTYSNLQAECHGPCAPGAGNQSEINSGKTEQIVADVGLVFGLVGVAAAVTLYVMSIPAGPSKTDKVTLDYFVGPGWMGVKGEF